MKLNYLSTVFWLVVFTVNVSAKEIVSSSDTAKVKQKIFEHSIRAIDNNGESSETVSSLQSRMQALAVPGVSIAVFDNNQILWAKGYGVSMKAPKHQVTVDTVFQAASISKAVTSVAAFQMIESGKFDLDENVNNKLIRWQVPENQHTNKHKVTPRNIMSHTSGLSVSGFVGYKTKEQVPSIIDILNGENGSNSAAVRVFQTPGQSEYYSGGGMTVLQLLMEDTSEQSFAALLKQQLLEPLTMTNSTFDLQPKHVDSSNIASGFDGDGQLIAAGHHFYPEKAAAGLWSTPSDLAKFMIALGQAYRGESEKLLSQQSAKIMLTRVPSAGGTGIGIDGKAQAFRFRHSGGNAGFTCYAVSFANSGKGFVVMTNSDNGFRLIHEISRALSEVYNWPAMWMRE